jgi:lipopolysaccharide export system permease protein
MYIDELVGKGLDFKVLAELLFQFSLTFVPTALPLAILLASLMTFGNMGEYNELTALKSSGISLQRIMQPLMILMGILVVSVFLFSNYIVPIANKEARGLLFDIRRKRPDISLQAGTFTYDIDGFSIKVADKDPETNRLDKILIYDEREKRGNVSVIYADSGYIRVSPDNTAMIMTLYNGNSFTEVEEKDVLPNNRKFPSRKDEFKEQTIVLSLSGFDLERSGDNLFRSTSWMLKMGELSHFIDSLTTLTDNRFDGYYEDFLENYLYKETPSPVELSDKSILSDISHAQLFLNVDSVFNALDNIDKEIAILSTIENVKETGAFIDERAEAMKVSKGAVIGYKADWHKKLTLPFACLIFFFIGAPLGAIIRKGGLGTPSVISVLFFVIWYVISLFGEKLVEGTVVHPVIGMWASSYILLPIGVLLTYKAATDSGMMNLETYTESVKNAFKAINRFFSFKKI